MYPIIGSGDHGLKAQGDGWLLTVALIEGINLAAVDSSGSSDPYVVFTCNGKTRTSSIKFQKSDPQWNGKCYFYSSASVYCCGLNNYILLRCEFYNSWIKIYLGLYLNII